MTKTKNTANALQAVLDRQSAFTEPEPPKRPAAPSLAPAAARRPSREGKRLIGGHFPPNVAKQLKVLAAEEGTSVQALLEEALDLLFVKKGKGRVEHV